MSSSPWHIRQAAHALHVGGVIAYPTETVFGLGCNPLNLQAVEKLLTLKQRPVEKGLILIGANLEQLMFYIDVTDLSLLEKLARPTERPTTWIAPARPFTPRWLTGKHNSIAVRITSHPAANALCEQFGGAIVSTSANPGGLAPARSTLKVRSYFDEQIDYLLRGNTPIEANPSEIRDLITDKVLRSN